MCGIAGVINFHEKPRMEGLMASIDKMIHRGPDDSGIWFDSNVGLAHRRLSIIDLSGGHQPMENESKTLVTIFNGEIYNYKELRSKLEKKGHRFTSESDTEIILHAYEEWQDSCFEKFTGMFAICLYDKIQERVVLARDLFGEKPLYIHDDDKGIVFSSELKAILELIDVEPKIDTQAIALYLRLGYIPAPYTLYNNIKKLPAGHLLFINKHDRTYKNYKKYVLGNIEEKNIYTEDKVVGELENALILATSRMLNADVPLGVFLSGGLDSSLIAAIIAHQGNSLETFSISFKNKTFDESHHAERVAQLIGANHTTSLVDLDSLPDCISIYDSFDEPFADPSAIPTYFLSQETRKKVTVALSGDGADEFWGGYRRYLAQKWANSYLKIPKCLRRNFIESSLKSFKDRDVYFADSKIKSAQLFINRINSCDSHLNLLYHRIFSYEDISNLFQWLSFDLDCVQHLFEQNYKDTRMANKLMGFDQNLYLPDDILVKVDRMSMQHSLEVRTPFLDPDVVKLSMKTPNSLKIKGKEQKYILKKVALNYLPEDIVFRKKHGFSVPISEWFRKLDKQKILQLMPTGCSQQAVEQIIDQHLACYHDNSQHLLTLAVLGRFIN